MSYTQEDMKVAKDILQELSWPHCTGGDEGYCTAAQLIHKHVEEAVAKAMGWHPISSAPKDGTEILVLTKTGYIYHAQFIDGYLFRKWNDGDFSEHQEMENAINWMPLPKPPTKEQG